MKKKQYSMFYRKAVYIDLISLIDRHNEVIVYDSHTGG